MSNTRWVKARDIQKGDTILFSVYQVKVAEIDGYLQDIIVTTNTGHKHNLKVWQDVQVLEEQEG